MLKKFFGFDKDTMKIRTELLAGLTTFLTMSYILAVNPEILGTTSMDKGSVFTATALSSAVATFLLAFIAKMPFALAPSMGINAFFAFTLVQGMGYSWQAALAVIFVEGIIFILITLGNIREKIVNSIPPNLRNSISVGIGMFIAFIGLKNAGIIVASPSTFVTLGEFTPAALVAFFGILLSIALLWRQVRGALFFSIILCTVIGIPFGVTHLPENFMPVSVPQSMEPTFLKFDFRPLLNFDMIVIVLILIFMDIFNTVGTLIGTAAQANLLDKDGNLPRMKQAMLADAVGTTFGSVCGTSTICTYVESAAGIAEGGRSGLTAATTGLLFLLALFFSPLFLIVPSAATTGSLFAVGVMMMKTIKEIRMDDLSDALPAFTVILTIVLTYSIAEGVALGLLSYTFIKLLTGQFRQISPTLYVLSALLVFRYIFG